LIQHFFGIFQIYDRELNRDYFSILSEGSVSTATPATGFFSYFNAFGLFIEIPTLFAIVFSYYSSGKERIKYIIVTFILLIGMYFSYSRGTYFSFLIAFLLTLTLGIKKLRLAVYTIVVLMIVVFFEFVLPYFMARPDQIATLMFRFSLWQNGYEYFSRYSNLFYGMGPGMFIPLTHSLFDVHNEYLMHLFENGIVGLAALLYLIIVLLKSSYSFFKESRHKIYKAIALACVVIFTGYFTQEIIEHSFNSITFKIIIFSICALLLKDLNDNKRWNQNILSK
jgi:O-antigen ligase